MQGVVQGVGFRPWVYRVARASGVDGRVREDASGGVVIEAFGRHDALDAFVANLKADPPPAARIRALVWESIPAEQVKGFVIVPTTRDADRRESLPADAAICDNCLAEVFAPSHRRFRYPFTSCAHCGPRFSLAHAAPFARANTSMAPFTMCDDCRAEFLVPESRRFRSPLVSCPACGPKALLVDAFEVEVPGIGDAIARAAKALDAGRVVAVKGTGGFQLAVRADRGDAVRLLRERKKCEERPLVVMVRTLVEARNVASLEESEEELLTSASSPVVLVRPREDSILAEEIAPRAARIGLKLADTALFHLLLVDAGAPLALTSANASDEPIAFRDDDALARVRGLADVFLVDDRRIENPSDDSIARVIAGQPALIRRSRGWVPRGVPIAGGFAHPVLATGADHHNAFCVGLGEDAFLSPHLGDLGNPASLARYEATLERFLSLLRVVPEVIAHDLHPAWAATRWARENAERMNAKLVSVQHHHAHVVSAMAEHGIARPVLGLAFDGGGYGDDGSLWGGEFLFADAGGYRRLATFRALPLAGGERAVHDVWRIALAMLDDAFGIDGWSVDEYPLFHGIAAREISIVRRMIDRRVNAPMSHGLGRWFDAFGALGLARPRTTFDGQIALAWDAAAAEGRSPRAYPWDLDERSTPWQIDLRPAVRAAAIEVRVGAAPGSVAAKFHETVIAAATEVSRRLLRELGHVPIVLTGGCFQNAHLAEGLLDELVNYSEVLLHGSIPAGDGGIALGQAVVADALARRG